MTSPAVHCISCDSWEGAAGWDDAFELAKLKPCPKCGSTFRFVKSLPAGAVA